MGVMISVTRRVLLSVLMLLQQVLVLRMVMLLRLLMMRLLLSWPMAIVPLPRFLYLLHFLIRLTLFLWISWKRIFYGNIICPFFPCQVPLSLLMRLLRFPALPHPLPLFPVLPSTCRNLPSLIPKPWLDLMPQYGGLL